MGFGAVLKQTPMAGCMQKAIMRIADGDPILFPMSLIQAAVSSKRSPFVSMVTVPFYTSKLRRFNPAGNIPVHRGSDKVSVCVFC